ncbi:hypothetical protein KIN20_005989 [Parelaphostrongylus tenuis]|uniref:Uncharacterized protein n=1 Tax=Parelaphostrongylus tenuis TaxID=148309 RepID=A0AAD5QHX8_PARTN|nr:hypothetical protein KIN20_005989 [Parelaphostrongylus tenuis]
MAYAGKPEVSNRVPGISADKERAQAFVQRLVMQTVASDSRFLPDVSVEVVKKSLTE